VLAAGRAVVPVAAWSVEPLGVRVPAVWPVALVLEASVVPQEQVRPRAVLRVPEAWLDRAVA
jgi:hypothetical protein